MLYRYATIIALDAQGTSAAAYLDELIDVWDPLEWVAHDEDEDDAEADLGQVDVLRPLTLAPSVGGWSWLQVLAQVGS